MVISNDFSKLKFVIKGLARVSLSQSEAKWPLLKLPLFGEGTTLRVGVFDFSELRIYARLSGTKFEGNKISKNRMTGSKLNDFHNVFS